MPRDAKRLLFNFLADFVEVCESLVDVEKLRPFAKSRAAGRGLVGLGGVYELQHQWAASDNALPTRQEISPDNPM